MIYNNIEEFLALKPRHYRFLKSINLKRNISEDNCSLYEVEIVLSNLGDSAPTDLLVRCTNAFDIKIASVEGMPGLFVDIEDVRIQQLEDGAYRIAEQEEGAFSFYCEEFFAELI
ncbi:hypothetical protein [Agarilytica rhodophyticola]|uniref:hypothetical protein n=1 Tax=Agarilytica rhodophyticola TaxID=1737490 RepID=UPI000B345197|nr:hypothetical protein [Agarilytica rhodophyticola]